MRAYGFRCGLLADCAEGLLVRSCLFGWGLFTVVVCWLWVVLVGYVLCGFSRFGWVGVLVSGARVVWCFGLVVWFDFECFRYGTVVI